MLYRILLIFNMLPSIICAQSTESLLWEIVSPCANAVNGNYRLKDDRADKGYLKIVGKLPECNCRCESVARVFERENSYPVYIKNESFSCAQSNILTSTVPFDDILPESFNLSVFADGKTLDLPMNSRGLFCLKGTIPSSGNEVRFTLDMVPFGMTIPTSNLICLDQLPEMGTINQDCKARELVSREISNMGLAHIRIGEFNKLTPYDRQQVARIVDETYSREQLQKDTQALYELYEVVEQLTFATISMTWDEKSGKFIFLKGINRVEHKTFKTFLDSVPFYTPTC